MDNQLVWAFADRCDAARSASEVREAFLREVNALGFAYVACCSHVDPLHPPPDAVVMIEYPQMWLERFVGSPGTELEFAL